MHRPGGDYLSSYKTFLFGDPALLRRRKLHALVALCDRSARYCRTISAPYRPPLPSGTAAVHSAPEMLSLVPGRLAGAARSSRGANLCSEGHDLSGDRRRSEMAARPFGVGIAGPPVQGAAVARWGCWHNVEGYLAAEG